VISRTSSWVASSLSPSFAFHAVQLLSAVILTRYIPRRFVFSLSCARARARGRGSLSLATTLCHSLWLPSSSLLVVALARAMLNSSCRLFVRFNWKVLPRATANPPRVFREPSRAEIFGATTRARARARALRADDPPRTWPLERQ